MSLVHDVVSECHKRLIPIVDPFPDRSKTRIFPMRCIMEDDLKIDVLALERAKSLSLSENIEMRYNKTYPK